MRGRHPTPRGADWNRASGGSGGNEEAGGFGETVLEIEGLDGLTRRALTQVVDRGNQHRLLAPRRDADVAKIRSPHAPGVRNARGEDPDKRRALVGLLEKGPN